MPAIDPRLSIDAVTLGVADLERSADFYERVLGLVPIAREPGAALLGPDPQRPALELQEITAPTPMQPRATGLFHVAWLHPTRGDLAATIRRVVEQRWPFTGASDHGVSEALYLNDPDGLGIEIYADRPREAWERPPGGRGVVMVTLALDVDDLLAQGPVDGQSAIAPATTIGHVHLKVSDVPRAASFYRDALGFEEQATMPSAAFLSAGGYHHHLGLNSWQSARGPSPEPSAPGLREVRFALSTDDELERLARLSGAGAQEGPGSAGASVSVRDPDGQLLTFASP